jgi:metal-responsive CopG/Arc/MetJ family transcriptional regulator
MKQRRGQTNISFFLYDDILNEVDEYIKSEDIDRSKFLRKSVVEYLINHTERRK